MSDLIYKYTDLNGALRIISSVTLKFTRPSALNDPFDIYIEDFPGINHDKFKQESVDLFFNLIKNDPKRAAHQYGIPLDKINHTRELLNKQSPEKLEQSKKFLQSLDFAKLDKGFAQIDIEVQQSRNVFIQTFNNQGIFCVTKDCSNLLMWAHYADAHKGAVLGFRPNLEKDSALRLVEPVLYIKDRQELLATADEILASGNSHEKLRNLYNKIIHTKSIEWEYEQEWRVSIPDAVTGSESAYFMNFYPEELAEVYLGARMSVNDKRMLTLMAKVLNSETQIYNMSLGTKKYILEPTKIA